MKKDIIQESLEIMERISPSENSHPKSFIGRIKDKIYFFRRAYSGTVEEKYSNFGYDPNDVWYNRLNSIERLAKKGKVEFNTYSFIETLSQIASDDDDWRIKKLCLSMLESFDKKGDFSETNPYKEKIAEEERMKIKVASELDYDPTAIWYDRLDAVEKLAESKIDTEKFRGDLEVIAEKEDDWRVRTVVNNLLDNSQNNNRVVAC